MAGYVAPLLEAGDGKGTQHGQLVDAIVARSGELTAGLAAAAWPEPYFRKLSAITGKMAWLSYEEAARHAERRLSRRPRFDEVAADLGALSWIAIRNHPGEYAKQVTAIHYGLWRYLFAGGNWHWGKAANGNYRYSRQVMDFPTTLGHYNLNWAHWLGEPPPSRRGLVSQFTDTAHYYEDSVHTRYRERRTSVSLVDCWWQGVSAASPWLTIVMLLLSLLPFPLLATRLRQDPALQFCACAAFLLHAGMLLIAVFHDAEVRYLLPLHPLIPLLLLGLLKLKRA